MPRLPVVRAREVIRALQRLGFERVRQRGSHITMHHPDGRTTIVPDHGTRDLHPNMTYKTLKDAKVSISDFLAAL
jgi:predicted RNA binding protein YcfA (HicA-like mRNA interferase family)